MALIRCPECNKEISDKSQVCIHCGYPLNSDELETSTIINDIQKQCEQLQTVLLKTKDEFYCYISFKKDFDTINKSDISSIEYDNIVIMMFNYIVSCRYYIGWKHIKRYFELVDFYKISPNGYNELTDKILTEFKVSKFESGYLPDIVYWYLIYQILKKAPVNSQNKIKNQEGINIYSIYTFAAQHLGDDVSIKKVNTDYHNINHIVTQSKSNIPKCPTCGSTNIKPISTTKKAIGFATFGVFSNNFGKTMECKNCGYKW